MLSKSLLPGLVAGSLLGSSMIDLTGRELRAKLGWAERQSYFDELNLFGIEHRALLTRDVVNLGELT